MWIARVSCLEGRCSFYPVDLSLATDQSINRPDRSGIPHGIRTLINVLYSTGEKTDRPTLNREKVQSDTVRFVAALEKPTDRNPIILQSIGLQCSNKSYIVSCVLLHFRLDVHPHWNSHAGRPTEQFSYGRIGGEEGGGQICCFQGQRTFPSLLGAWVLALSWQPDGKEGEDSEYLADTRMDPHGRA